MTSDLDVLGYIPGDLEFGVAAVFGIAAGQQVSTGMCCCCPEPRAMIRFGGDNEEWGHVSDGMYAEHRHVHVVSSSRDCDGRYDFGHVYRIPSIREEALRPVHLRSVGHYHGPDFHDLWLYLIRHEPPMHGDDVNIQIVGKRAAWSYSTDEGGGGGDMWICEDTPCAHDPETFRDHTAEAAGY